MQIYFYLIALAICIINISAETLQKCRNNTHGDCQNSSKVLSRRKRYLTFPDGSSFQLVFCAQNHGYIQLGDIVWFATTAALAWELPTDPKYLSIFKEHKKIFETTGNRRSDASKVIYYLDEDGKVIGKRPYKRKPFVSPVFAKRSVDTENRITAKELHEMHTKNNFLKNVPLESIEFHREGRKDLYEKIETFLNGMGWNGEECVLRFLCEANKEKPYQGTFLEEIFKATFSLPRGPEFQLGKHKRYDSAHGSDADCGISYPNCEYRESQLFDQ
ncbi:uncharacterized protein LOC106143283 [Amyelois transitella]|uniref:uncharacterized protein LOC106143283 n=1 Tax=Amyelois transitella TaxID=680683 RepID=UPI0029900A66|nr:uncharacterized protein LOC106143283 [Amyelois transitella]